MWHQTSSFGINMWDQSRSVVTRMGVSQDYSGLAHGIIGINFRCQSRTIVISTRGQVTLYVIDIWVQTGLPLSPIILSHLLTSFIAGTLTRWSSTTSNPPAAEQVRGTTVWLQHAPILPCYGTAALRICNTCAPRGTSKRLGQVWCGGCWTLLYGRGTLHRVEYFA